MSVAAYPVDGVIALVASFHQLDREDLLGRNGAQAILWPRHELVYVLRQVCRMTLHEIGRAIGGRDEKTVQNSIKRVEHRRSVEPAYDEAVSDLLHAVVFAPKAVAHDVSEDLLGCIRALLRSEQLTDGEARRAALAILPASMPPQSGPHVKEA